jgi:predicted RNA-binding protein with PUA-like domain
MQYWFIRSPYKNRTWEDILMQGNLRLYGIRSYESRNNIAVMQQGEKAVFYKGGTEKNIKGVLEVSRTAFPDPTSSNNWLAIDLAPVQTFEVPILWSHLKSDQRLSKEPFMKQPRITVSKLSTESFYNILSLGNQN